MSSTRAVTERRPEVAPEIAAAGDVSRDFIFVRDFVLGVNVGVYAEEKGVTQEISFSIEAYLSPGVKSVADDIAEVPSYADIIDGIEAIARQGHIELVETFAERIAAHCLKDRRIAAVRVRLEKLERGPRRGVEIFRKR
jgi:dihydroneopterin aldolase